MFSVGIVGLPNVGKSTLFNALGQAAAQVSIYPFCTVQPNRATVPVPDDRLRQVAELAGQERAIPTTIEFVDIAGLVRGASKGEGLGNQFLAHIREADAVLHTVRCFLAERVAHVEGTLNPVRDIELVELELALADLSTVQKALTHARSKAKAGDKAAREAVRFLEGLQDHLAQGLPAARASVPTEHAPAFRDLHLLTAKPVVYALNVGEQASTEMAGLTRTEEWLGERGARFIEVAAQLECELGELSAQDAAALRGEFDLPGQAGSASALEQVIVQCYQMLNLVTFFTCVGKEARAWTLAAGTPARRAAGKIHTDMEAGFIKAEVCDLPTLERAGSWAQAKEAGLIRMEGQDYPIRDGDVIQFRFTRT